MKIITWSGIAIIAVLAACIALFFAFDWNYAKPWLNQRISAATGRPFAIQGDLAVHWYRPAQHEPGWWGWVPWPELTAKDIIVGNPDWVKAAPEMANIRQLAFSLSPLALLDKRIVIPSLQLDNPSVYLQRERDGRNNWTFNTGNMNTPSEWKFDVRQFVLNKGSVHLVDAIRKADVKADIDTLPDPGKDNYRLAWSAGGTLNGDVVKGKGKAGAILSLQQQSAPYPLQADLQVGKTSIHLQGSLTKPSDLAALDLQLKISGVSLGHLYRLTGILLPETPPFATEGHLSGALNAHGGNWTYEKFRGQVGASDISGTLDYIGREPRPLLKGRVTSSLLKFQDLAPLIGADSNASKIRREAESLQPTDKVLPVEQFKTERWTSIDTDVYFSGRRIVRNKELPIDNLVTHVQLQNGMLSLAPLNFGIAGGNLVSNLKLDGRSKPVKAQMKIAARHLKLKQLFPAFEPMQASLGEINGDASLSATGNSIAALLGSSNGELKAVIDQGTISKLLLEEMGLNVGNIIMAQLFGDRQVKLNCLASDFKVTNGVMDTRIFVMDTEDATLYVNGQVNLAQENLNLTLSPDSKGVRVISLRSPLYVSGPFKKPNVKIDKSVLAIKTGTAIALGVLAPVVTALIPLVNMGPGKNSPCSTLLAQAGKKPEAPPPGKTASRK